VAGGVHRIGVPDLRELLATGAQFGQQPGEARVVRVAVGGAAQPGDHDVGELLGARTLRGPAQEAAARQVRPFVDRPLPPARVARADVHRAPLGDEQAGDLLADALVGAGDQCCGIVHGDDDSVAGAVEPGTTGPWQPEGAE